MRGHMGRRWGLPGAAVVLAGFVVAAPTLGASGPSTRTASGVPPDFTRADIERMAPRLDRDPAVKRLVAAEQRRLAQKEQFAASPAGQAAAARSKHAHRNSGPAEAAALAAREFPDLAGPPTWEALSLEPGDKVDAYLSDYSARVDRSEGPNLVAMSTFPLRAKDATGALRRVDLALKAQGNAFVADNPLVDTKLPESLEDGITVGGGGDAALKITPQLAANSGHIENGRVFYGGGTSSIDIVVTPAPAGLQLTAIVRAADAAQDVPLDFELPTGASLRLDAAGMLVIERDGKQLYRVTPPAAVDAAARPVDARYDVVGGRAVLHVAHRAADTTYPVAVDPMIARIDLFRIADANAGNRSGTGDTFAGWAYYTSRPGLIYQGLDPSAGTPYGLAVVAPPAFYNGGDFGEWVYPTPSNDVYIERADFAYVDHVTSGSCLLEGLFNPLNGQWNTGTSLTKNGPVQASPTTNCAPVLSANYQAHCPGASCVPETPGDPQGTGGNWAVIALTMGGLSAHRSQTHYVGMYGAVIWMYDNYDPAISTLNHGYSGTDGVLRAGLPSGWIDNVNLFHNAVVQDRGLGPVVFGVNSDTAVMGTSTRACPPNTKPSRCYLGAWQSGNVGYNSANSLADGVRTMSAYGIDAVGRLSAAQTFQLKVDHVNPSAALGGALFAAGGAEAGETHPLTVDLNDVNPTNGALATSGVASYTLTVAGRTVTPKNLNCSATVQCHRTEPTITHNFDTAGLEPGTYSASVTVRDGVGRSTTVTRPITLADTKAPKLVVTGGLRIFVESDRTAVLTGTDTSSGLDTLELERRTSSVAGSSFARVAFVDHCPTNMGCPKDPKSLSYTLPADTPAGEYEFRAIARDRVGNQTTDVWKIKVVSAIRSGGRGKLGLEQWFVLDETPTGGDSTAYVNGENGNLIWHGTPIVNPGRGLSSVVNLTYNSQDRGGLLGLNLGSVPLIPLGDVDDILGADLTGTSYKQAGTGFSISVSGPTRVNEPLSGVMTANLPAVAGRITMTDPDGTAHVFSRSAGSDVWRAPAGVNMRLRYTAPPSPLLPSIAALEGESVWQLLRPDGTKHTFDRYGYLQKTVDRNANTLDYVYEGVKPLLGGPCTTSTSDLLGNLLDVAGLCVPRLLEIRAPSWAQDHTQKMSFTYTAPTPVENVLGTIGLQLPNELGLGWLSGAVPQISGITDAAGRTYTFDYCANDKAYLCSFTENAGGTQVEGQGEPQRKTSFTYEEPPGLSLGADVKQLKTIVPVVNGAGKPGTEITYKASEQESAGPGLGFIDPLLRPTPRRVGTIKKRNGALKEYVYTKKASTRVVERFVVHEHTEANRHLTTDTQLDSQARPGTVGTRTSAKTGDAFAAVASQGSTTTNLTWNNAENKIDTLVEAAATPDARTTNYTYATTTDASATASGAVTKRTVAAKGKTREWSFEYSDAVEGGFVSDRKKATLPGGRAWEFTVEPATGNELARKGPDGILRETTYDAKGQVTSSKDEMNRVTTIPSADYHVTGQPQTVTLPPDAGVAARTWRYRYDAVGNTRQVLDPRASAAVPLPNGLFATHTPYATTLFYDGFDRLVSEHLPRCVRTTGPEPCQTSDATADDYEGPAFVDRSKGFDRNGNVVRVTDEENKVTEITPDAMDQPQLVRQPNSSGNSFTDFVYDNASRLVGTFAPLGHTGANLAAAKSTIAMCEGGALAPQAYLTRRCLDHRGLPLAEVSTSVRNGDPSALITSNTYDARGNLAGQRDALRNSTPDPAAPKDDSKRTPVTPAAAITAVAQPGGARTESEFDLLDRVVVERERPTEATATVRERRTEYDDKDDLKQVTVEDGDADRVTSMAHDSMGRVVSSTDPVGRMTCYRRQADGLVTHETSPRGTVNDTGRCTDGDPYEAFTTRTSYDALGAEIERTIPYATQQYGEGRDDVRSWRVNYKRDVVGNPVEITDARRHAFTNDFYADGTLRSSTRPSWWELEWDGDGNPDGGERYAGNDAADLEMAADGPTLVERTGAADPGDGDGEEPESLGKGDFGAPEQAEMPDWLPRKGMVRVRYDATSRLQRILDREGRASSITYDDAGRVTRKAMPFEGISNHVLHSYDYDQDDNVTNVEQDRGNDLENQDLGELKTTFVYDGYDRRVSETTSGANAVSAGSAPQDETTLFTYGPNGTLVGRVTPRGPQFDFEFGYDSLDQLISEANPEDELWSYSYDRHGDRTTVVAPGAADPDRADALYTATLGYDRAGQLTSVKRLVDIHDAGDEVEQRVLETTYEYDGDGNLDKTVSPGASERRATTVEHDGRGLAWRTIERRAAADVSDAAERRISITEFDANGNLRRDVKPSAILPTTRLPRVIDTGTNDMEASKGASVYTYDDDDLKTLERLPWDDKRDQAGAVIAGQDDGRYARRFERADNEDGRVGRLTSLTMPYDLTAANPDLFRTSYEYNDAGWIVKASDAKRMPRSESLPDRAEMNFTYAYDEQGNQLRWRSQNYSRTDLGRELRWEWWPNAQLKRRIAEKPNPGSAPSVRRYEYTYNANRSLAKVIDEDSDREADGKQRRTTRFERDGAEREVIVDERFDGVDGSPVSKRFGDSVHVYDDYTGELRRRDTDGVLNASNEIAGASKKSTSYRYDALGREYRMSVLEAAAPVRETYTRWHDSGQRQWRRKPNATRDVWDYNALGETTAHKRIGQTPTVATGGDSSDPSPVSYDYDTNGNRTSDERGTHRFNSRDQLVWWTHKTGANPNYLTKYDLNGSGAMLETTDSEGGAERSKTTFTYDGDRLEKTSTAAGGQTQTKTFRYDDSGNVQRIYSQDGDGGGALAPGKTALSPSQCKADDLTLLATVTRYCYDEFNRQVFASGSGIDNPSLIAYDGLDRRSTKQNKLLGLETEMRYYAYLGASEVLTSEHYSRGLILKEERSHTYDYDSQGDRVGQATNAGASFRAYAKDANGSVTGLEDAAGAVSAADTYHYDPYGGLDRVGILGNLEGGLSTAAQENPFRFQGFYYDAGTQTYDMHARAYKPDIGRFLSQDIYASASGDLALQADPLTQNRYTFAGGNPVLYVELDGHGWRDYWGGAFHGATGVYVGGKRKSKDFKRASRVATVATLATPAGWVRTGTKVGGRYVIKRIVKSKAPKAKPKPRPKSKSAQTAKPRKAKNAPRKRNKRSERAGSDTKQTKTADKADETVAGKPGGAAAGSCRTNSFTGPTLVLMADGRQKPISQVRVGDWVVATDPATGVTLPKQVTDLIAGTGPKQLKRIVAAGQQVVATDHHPFYTANTRSWTHAAELQQGDQLVGADGSLQAVSGLIDADQTTTVYNLTVDEIHTYYAGQRPVLVHNCGGTPGNQMALPPGPTALPLARDLAASRTAPAVRATTRSVGRPSHNQELQSDIATLPFGARDIRVNQQQLDAAGNRVGLNRPDLQYTLGKARYHIEYEGLTNPRGAAHETRIFANDPNAVFILKLIR